MPIENNSNVLIAIFNFLIKTKLRLVLRFSRTLGLYRHDWQRRDGF